MAAAGRGRSEDHFLCPICQDFFTDPITISCGHNVCKSCITRHWDIHKNNQCPKCTQVSNTKPHLISTFISKIASQFRHEDEPNISDSDQQAAKAGEVPCDICTGTNLKAIKSCLMCLTSYCETHLEPHLTLPGLKQHQLIDPVENLDDRMCKEHDRPLELFCKTDHNCVCSLCPVSEHKDHELVLLEEEREEQKSELKKTEAEIQQMIQERRLKIQEIQQSVELNKTSADRETAEGVEVFTALMESVQRRLDQFKEEIQLKQRNTQKQAEEFIKELKQEISELQKRSTEVQQLSGSEDHLHFVQRFTSVKDAPPMKTWTKVNIHPQSFEGTVVRAVSQLKDKLTGDMKKVMVEAELKRVRQFEVDVTLDPDTAHEDLILSEDGKQVHGGGERKKLPDKPQRFTVGFCVLAKQSFSSGRFYFEVQVKGKSYWELGVTRESITRKGEIRPSPKNGYWMIGMVNISDYYARTDDVVRLSVKSDVQKVGVFVDFEEGVVSFYDVDSALLLYSFTDCHFNDKILPCFCPWFNVAGPNSAPLIISRAHTK